MFRNAQKRRNIKKQSESLFTLAASEITTVNLKIVFDNMRNYGLVALTLHGGISIFSFGGISQLLGAVALLISAFLLAANVLQTYLIAYKYFWGSQEKMLGEITDEGKIKYKIWCAFLSLSTGGSLMYAMYVALEILKK